MITYFKYTDGFIKNEEILEFIYHTMVNAVRRDANIILEELDDIRNINTTYIKNKGEIFMAVNEAKRLIGTIGIEIKGDYAKLRRFYVQEEYRGQKIGLSLYTLAEEYAKRTGLKVLYLITGKYLVRAHNIYEENGWVKLNEEERKKAPFTCDEEQYLYRKYLK